MEIQRQLSDDDKARVDMTPMLDVVFILLIFFIVTASFIRATSLELSTAPPNRELNTDADGILLSITSTDEIWLGDRRIDKCSVRGNIERLCAEGAARALAVQLAPESTTAALVTAMDSAREAGIYNISLSRLPPPEVDW